mmetsp:Transcript_54517/g.152005  ORF Transcript_54517/g.152005 Transcript_54517/m.152005 type:complete len:226 (-) Transcript_54517:664-1341(-)
MVARCLRPKRTGGSPAGSSAPPALAQTACDETEARFRIEEFRRQGSCGGDVGAEALAGHVVPLEICAGDRTHQTRRGAAQGLPFEEGAALGVRRPAASPPVPASAAPQHVGDSRPKAGIASGCRWRGRRGTRHSWHWRSVAPERRRTCRGHRSGHRLQPVDGTRPTPSQRCTWGQNRRTKAPEPTCAGLPKQRLRREHRWQLFFHKCRIFFGAPRDFARSCDRGR